MWKKLSDVFELVIRDFKENKISELLTSKKEEL